MSSIDPIPDSEDSEEEKPTTEFLFGQMPLPQANPATVVNPEQQGLIANQVIADTGTSASVWNRLFPADVVSEGGGVQQTIPNPKGIRLDHFVLEERIGIGGMGSVFRAIDERLERVVALKILSPAQTRDPGSIMRFLNEAKAAARLDHDNIARVFYIGEDSGLNFIAFEYVTGTNIRDLIRRYGQLDPAEAINYSLQVAYALKHTSAASVVHRDIKPSNIIVTTSGRAKLVDLGLARKQNTDSYNEITVAGTTLGTFDYISPEQAKDPRNVDVRSDIYSLGCTLYHMLTGSAPYPEGTMMQKLLSHQESDPPNPAEKNKNVTPGLAAIVQRMMASEPRYRHQSADELIHALLLVAGSYGMKGVNPEGLIWRASQTPSKKFWEKNLGWFTTVVLLLIIVFSINRFQPAIQNRVLESIAQNETDSNNATINIPNTDTIKSLDPPNNSKPTGNVGLLENTPSISSNDPNYNNSKPFVNDIVKDIFDKQDPPFYKIDTEPKNDPKKQLEMIIPEKQEDPKTKPIPAKTLNKPENEIKIAVLSGNGDKPHKYPTVESALAEAEDGSVIELRYNGAVDKTSEKFWKLNNKNITIRAGTNSEGELFHPVIKFDTDLLPDNDDSQFISISSGSLELVDVDLSFDIKNNTTQTDWDLFTLSGPDQLRMRRVSVVVTSSPLKKVSLVSLTLQNSPIVDETGNASGQSSSGKTVEVRFVDCFIKGNCQLVTSNHILPVHLSIENSILAIQGPVIYYHGDTNMPMENQEIKLTMEHVTCLLEEGLIQIETGDLPRSVLPLNVSARNNIFATGNEQPFVSMSGKNTKEEFRGFLNWFGEKNFYENYNSYWFIQPEQISEKPENLNFSNWNQIWSGAITSSMQNKLVWRNEWRKKDILEIKATDLELAIPEKDDENKHPIWRASDEGNVGANLILFFKRPYDTEENLKSSGYQLPKRNRF